MGKGYPKKKPRVLKRDFKEQRPDVWEERRIPNENGDGYQQTPQQNEAFEEYYKRQEIVPDGEWDAFMSSLRTPLPSTFRINGTGKFAAQLRDKLETDFFSKLQKETVEVEGEPLVPPRPLPWYPQKLAWQLTYSRTQLRKLKALTEVHELLKRENVSGGITRQEAVSMVPPLFLDIEPHHKILDTCAAPGSKTVQMLEMLHERSELPTGFIVANDSEPQRCNLLVHQTKRMNSPALVVTNHDASAFPQLSRKGGAQCDALRFDRVLCDVPCSGDGTLRKAPDLWRRWNINQGTGLHPLQVRITLHAAGLLAVGGRMVYSTCSFNPVEDEAVVAEVLRQANGALELIDVADRLDALKRCRGKRQWLLRGTKGEYFSSLDAAEQASNANSFSVSMFPDAASREMPLERCMRILPHHGDTGGFFIAVLEKRAEMPPVVPDRWKRSKDRMADKRKEYKAKQQAAAQDPLPGPGPATAEAREEAGAQALRSAVEPQPFADRPGVKAKADTDQNISKEFEEDMEHQADEAAQAAVTFADAVAEQDVLGAVDASAEAADAAEEVAGLAEARKPVLGNSEQRAEGQGSAQLEDNEGIQTPSHDGKQGQQPDAPCAAPKKQRKRKSGEEPIQLVKDSWILDGIMTFFGLHANFPIRQQLVSRSGIKDDRGARRIYFVTSGIIEMVYKDEGEALKVTSAGLKVFERNDKKDPSAVGCVYRMSQDGLRAMLPYVTRQILHPTASEMLRLLKERLVVLPAGQRLEPKKKAVEPNAKRAKTEARNGPASAAGEEAVEEADEVGDKEAEEEQKLQKAPRMPICDLETLQELEGIQGGCCICTLRKKEAQELGLWGFAGDTSDKALSQIAIVCWRGRASISILVDKASALQMAEKLEDAIQKFAVDHNPASSTEATPQ